MRLLGLRLLRRLRLLLLRPLLWCLRPLQLGRLDLERLSCFPDFLVDRADR